MITTYPQCRYVKHDGTICSGEAVDDDPKVIALCIHHLAKAMELIKEKQALQRATTGKARA